MGVADAGMLRKHEKKTEKQSHIKYDALMRDTVTSPMGQGTWVGQSAEK
jgi:hypothetical protein